MINLNLIICSILKCFITRILEVFYSSACLWLLKCCEILIICFIFMLYEVSFLLYISYLYYMLYYIFITYLYVYFLCF